jgi:hypothetical protein
MQLGSLRCARLATAGFSIIAAITACSSSSPAPLPAGSSGGDLASGGNSSNGGAVASGGAAVSGGQVGNGGKPANGGQPGNGGAANGGGATSSGNGGDPQSGGAATGGRNAASGGAVATGGIGPATGGKAAGGTTGTGGAANGGVANGGKASGGVSSGGAPATGGKATGGTTTAGGTSASGGAATGGATSTTGCGTKNGNPFSCKFAWGAPSSGTNYSYLNFVSTWVGDEANGGLASWSATATNNSCGDCALVQTVAGTSSMVVFYTYFIGFQACKMGGYCDCNTSAAPNLCSNGAQWIRNNRAQLLNAYGQYAKAVYARSPNKPVIWWLEGDFPQYNATSQITPLSYAELGQLTRDITCAIKSNQPNAIVASNHAPWLADDVTKGFWAAQPVDVLDLIWVQGAGDAAAFPNSDTYNAATATYAWLHNNTGLNIMAETSYASNGANDRWTTTTAANINARISSGVIGVLVNSPPSNYQTAISGFSSLNATCH